MFYSSCRCRFEATKVAPLWLGYRRSPRSEMGVASSIMTLACIVHRTGISYWSWHSFPGGSTRTSESFLTQCCRLPFLIIPICYCYMCFLLDLSHRICEEHWQQGRRAGPDVHGGGYLPTSQGMTWSGSHLSFYIFVIIISWKRL